MKKIILILIVLAAFINGNAQTNYYVSNTGDDTATGLIGFPWKTITEVNTNTFSPGASVLFERGGIWRDDGLDVSNSGTSGNPITYGAYGAGDNPILDGADVITGMIADSIVEWDVALGASSSSTTYYNFRQVISASDISTDGTQVRLQFEASTLNGVEIDGAAIGERSGTTDDFAAAPTRITFNDEDTIDIATSGSAWSDWITFDIDETKDYIVHIYTSDPTNGYRYTVSTGTAYRSTSSTDNTLTETVDYGASATSVRVVNSLEVRQGIWTKTGITTKPYIAWISDTLATLATSAALTDGYWFWSNDSLYVYSTTDPSDNIELGQRGILIDSRSEDYITVENLTLQHSNNRNTVGDLLNRGALYFYGGTGLTVTGCSFLDNSMHGLMSYSSSEVLVDNNTFLRSGYHNVWISAHELTDQRDITFSNNISNYAGTYGAIIYSASHDHRLVNVDIHGNTCNYNEGAGLYVVKNDTTVIYDNYLEGNGNETSTKGEDYGIGIQACNNIDVYNNTIINQKWEDAIQTWGGTESGVTGVQYCKNVRIFRNYISGVTHGDCIGIGVTTNGDASDNHQIFSNVLTGADKYGLLMSIGGIPDGTGSNIYVYNNTFANNTVGDFYTMKEFEVEIKNNIFASDVGTRGVYATLMTVPLTTSNNLYYRTTGTVLSYNGTTYTETTITGYEATAQTGDPLFTDAANRDYSVTKNSDAINNGIDVGLTEDILGNPVPSGGGYDIGAYEYQGVFKFMRNIATGKCVVTKDTGENVGRTEY